jgi:O-antigen/teichoic acid export membrane protein
MKPSLRQRVLAGTGANAVGQAITIGIQLISLPLFLHYWNANTYGTWLILSAIPSYLSMADVGMVTTAGNKMTMAIGQGDPVQASKVFQSTLLFVLLVCGMLALLVLPASLWLPLPGIGATPDERAALAALCAGVLLALFGGLADAMFKATGRYPLGLLLGNLVRLAEWGGAILGLVLVGNFSAVAMGGLLARAFGLMLFTTAAASGNHNIRWRVRGAQLAELRGMVKPALSFMLFPLTFALSLQGVTLLVGQMLGPAAVVIFNTYRTLARAAIQSTSVVSYALWPEFSRLYGVGGVGAVGPLYRRSARFGLVFSMLLSLGLYLLSPWLLQIWTHGVIGFQPLLMAVMLLYAAVGSAAHIPRTFLLATNEHVRLALWMLLTSIGLLGLAAGLGAVWGLVGFGTAMLMSEITSLWICLWLTHMLFSPMHKHITVA